MAALLWLAAILNGCSGSGSGVSTTAAAYRSFWSYQQQIVMQEQGQVFRQQRLGFNPSAYPAETAISFLSAWRATGDTAYLQTAERELEYAHSLESPDHFMTLAGFNERIRLSQARLIWGFMMAYLVTNNSQYLSWADEAMEAMLKWQRLAHTYQGKTYTIYASLYDPDPPYLPTRQPFLNPNQDATVGLADTMLYFTPASRYYRDATLGQIARDNLDAAIALQRPDGVIPEAETFLDHDDTRYGDDTLMKVFWANLYWNDPTYDAALRKSLPWLVQYTESGTTRRFAPTAYEGPLPDPTELFYRLPILYHYQQSYPRIKELIDGMFADPTAFRDMPGGFVCPTAAMELMGVPRSAGGW